MVAVIFVLQHFVILITVYQTNIGHRAVRRHNPSFPRFSGQSHTEAGLNNRGVPLQSSIAAGCFPVS